MDRRAITLHRSPIQVSVGVTTQSLQMDGVGSVEVLMGHTYGPDGYQEQGQGLLVLSDTGIAWADGGAVVWADLDGRGMEEVLSEVTGADVHISGGDGEPVPLEDVLDTLRQAVRVP